MRVPRSLALATGVGVAFAAGMTMQGSISQALAADPSASPSSQVVQPGEP